MKANFKKLSLLVHHRDKASTTQMLQEMGVVHLELDTNFRNDSIEEIAHRRNRIKKAIAIIENYANDEPVDTHIERNSDLTVDAITDQILKLKFENEANTQERELLLKNKLRLLPWGDFQQDKLERLAQSGISTTFYKADPKNFEQFDFAELTSIVINKSTDHTYFVVLYQGSEEPSLPFERVQLPAMGLAEITIRENKINRSQEAFAKAVYSYRPYLPMLYEALLSLENKALLQLANASYESHASGAIAHLQGWFPIAREKDISSRLEQQKHAYSISSATTEDDVPVLLKNPKYPKLFESITNIFQLPGRNEMDLTPFIAVFYPILFAYCLGDAGYGLILFSAAVIGWFTFLKNARNMAALGMVLGLFTTGMGVIKSGSVFGLPIVTDQSNPIFQFLSQYVLIPDDRGVVFNAFNVALMIGVVQVLVGIIVSIINKIRFKSLLASIPQIGKLLIVVSLIWMFLADMQGVSVLQPLSAARHIALILGVLLVLFFHDMKIPVLSRAASGILPLFFIVTGILGDVLSYVRLFALGVASSVLGLVVNQIGMQIMGDNWWGAIMGIIFLLFGHSLNFALASLGAFVHPLRLTFVEFYNNAQFQGGGTAYKPFKKINISNSK